MSGDSHAMAHKTRPTQSPVVLPPHLTATPTAAATPAKQVTQAAASLPAAVEALTYHPTRAQQQCKAKYWTSVVQGGTPSTGQLPTAQEVASQTSTDPTVVESWFRNPLAHAWFGNGQEFLQRLEFLAQISLDSLEELITGADTPANARVAAVKLVMDLARKTPAHTATEEFRDEAVGRMSREELEKFIASRTTRLNSDS